MKITKRSVVLTLSGLAATGVITGLGMTAQDVSAQPNSEAPTLGELFSPPPPPPSNVVLTPAALDFLRRTTGKLHVTFGDGSSHSATATVVNSESQDMLLTSGRALINKRGERPTEVRFVPGQRLIEGLEAIPHTPYGVWTARTWTGMPGFDDRSPYWAQNNVAVVLLNTRDGKHIQEVVRGAQGICFFDCPRRGQFHMYAYHAGHDAGESLDTTCQVIADFSNPELPFGTCIEGDPAPDDGTSGAPVLTDLDPNTGAGVIVAIKTWVATYQDGKKSNGGVYLGRETFALYEGYRRQ